jgi:hypothetical protein
MGRIASTAIDTALNGDQPRPRRFSGVKAVAAGAALAAAARVAVSKAPSIPGMSRISNLTDGVWDKLAEHGWIEDEEPPEDEEMEEPEAEAEEDEEEPDEDEEDEDEDDEEPEDEEPEQPEDEEPEQPEDDEPEDDEPEDPEDEEEPAPPGLELGETPDVMRALSDHPANRPPEPPQHNGGRNRKSKAGRS